MNHRVFGEIEGFPEGASFSNRQELARSGIHPPTQAGISYSAKEGADSIVLSGGYVDDEDLGDVIIYTGMGGRDELSGKQIADQELARGNIALALNKNEGLPVRVSRGAGHSSPLSPVSGYQYAGLYWVDDFWHEVGRDGFKVWRFRLTKESAASVQAPTSATATTTTPAPPRVTSTIQRVVRATKVSKDVKSLHNHQCQVCGTAIETPAGKYAEGAHIKPLGRPHNGPDVLENILCLCPNHHVMFDVGAFGVADDFTLIGGLSGSLRLKPRHAIGKEYLKYHREHYGLG